MKENCACGFIIEEPRGILLCHPTKLGNRWDFPKGWSEKGEDHFVAARRELQEETGIVVNMAQQVVYVKNKPDAEPRLINFQGEDAINKRFVIFSIVDLGQHPYQDHRDLHLFHMIVDHIDNKSLFCESMVKNPKGPDYPEMDAFVVFPRAKVLSKVTPRIQAWFINHANFHKEENHE